MNDGASKPDDEGTVYHQPNWNVGTVNQKVVIQSDPAPAELTPEQLAAAETRYRAQVVERYNRLGFAGLGISGSNLSELPLDDVFVRLTLTVEKEVPDPTPPKERERKERSRNPFHRGEKKEDDRPRERTITVQEPITLGEALAQHALIVGEPGAGKSTLTFCSEGPVTCACCLSYLRYRATGYGSSLHEIARQRSVDSMQREPDLPKFANEDEEREFWANVDLGDYMAPEDFEPVAFPNLKPTTRPVSIRIRH